jgi:hypothetical protein
MPLVSHGERIAIVAVIELKLVLEVRAPQIVRCSPFGQRCQPAPDMRYFDPWK